jgi:hypothetical protein
VRGGRESARLFCAHSAPQNASRSPLITTLVQVTLTLGPSPPSNCVRATYNIASTYDIEFKLPAQAADFSGLTPAGACDVYDADMHNAGGPRVKADFGVTVSRFSQPASLTVLLLTPHFAHFFAGTDRKHDDHGRHKVFGGPAAGSGAVHGNSSDTDSYCE